MPTIFLKKTSNGNVTGRVRCATPSGGNENVTRASVTTVVVLSHPKNLPWITSYPSPGAVKPPRAMSSPAVKNATIRRSSFCPWNGKPTSPVRRHNLGAFAVLRNIRSSILRLHIPTPCIYHTLSPYFFHHLVNIAQTSLSFWVFRCTLAISKFLIHLGFFHYRGLAIFPVIFMNIINGLFSSTKQTKFSIWYLFN